MNPRIRAAIKLVLLIVFLLAVVILFRYTPLGEYVSIASFRSAMESLDPILARLSYVGLYIVGTILLIPGVLMSFVGAVLFGVWEGTLYTWTAAVVGATLSFLVAKGLGRDFVEGLLGGRLAALDQRLRLHGFSGLLVIRLIPLFPFNGVNFGCGLTSIRPRDYVLATAIGILPGTFVYQFLFARFGQKILDEGFAWGDLADPVLIGAMGLFVLFLFVGKVVAARLSETSKESANPVKGRHH